MTTIPENPQLSELHDCVSTVTSDLPVVSFSTDTEGRLVAIERWELLGLARPKVGFEWTEFVVADDRKDVEREWNRCREAEIPWEQRFCFRSGRGTRVPVVGRATPVRSPEGDVRGYVGTWTEQAQSTATISALIDARNRLREIASNLPGILYQLVLKTDDTLRIEFVSEAVQTILGYSVQQITAPDFDPFSIAHPDDVEAAIAEAERSAERMQSSRFELRFRTVDGAYRWLHASASPVRRRNGEVVWNGVAVDITAQKEAEEALRRSQERLKRAQYFGQIGDWEYDLQSDRMVWSDEVFRLFERDPSLGPPCSYDEHMAEYEPEERERLNALVARTIERNEPTEVDMVRRTSQGRRQHLRAVIHPVAEKGEVVKLIGTVQDVTEQKETEHSLQRARRELEQKVDQRTADLRKSNDELRESEALFQNMADHAPVMVWLSDVDGRCTYVSQPWIDFTGRPREDHLGDQWADMLHPEDAGYTIGTYRMAFAVREPFDHEFRARRHDGEYRWMFCRGIPRFTKEGQFQGFIGSMLDVTDHKTAERQLQQRERLVSLGTLAAGIAHDINNPLQAIRNALGAARRFLQRGNQTERVSDCVDLVERATDRAARIVQNVLRFAQEGDVEREPVDLAALVAQCVAQCEEVARRKNVVLENRAVGRIPTMFGNACELEQVFDNLVRNAIEASPSGESVDVHLDQQGESLVVQVTDRGRGMAPEEREHAFEPFYTTREREGGTGLGLSIAYGIARQHGGSIVIDSEPGAGTSVRVELPLGEAAWTAGSNVGAE